MTETHNNIIYDKEITSDIVVNCPHCQEPVLIEKLNCRIFRHGTYINTNEQIPPHTSKEICDNLVQEKRIYGCGKPFQIVEDPTSEWCAIVCDYI